MVPWAAAMTPRAPNSASTTTCEVSTLPAQTAAGWTGASIEPGTYNYDGSRLYLDINGEYYLSRRFGLFASLRNINDVTDTAYAYGPSTPAYARFIQRNDYSAAWTFGLKGTF